MAFDPLALLRGNASFGYRQFKPVAADVPGYNGMTAALDLSYTAFGATKLTGKFIRDVQFSYEPTTPYYLQNGFMIDVIQQLFGPVDVAARAGRYNRGVSRSRWSPHRCQSTRSDNHRMAAASATTSGKTFGSASTPISRSGPRPPLVTATRG